MLVLYHQKRIDFIKRIKLENNFYAIFRNTIKILLNDYSNLKIRKEIEEVLGNNFLLYTEKFNKIEELFKNSPLKIVKQTKVLSYGIFLSVINLKIGSLFNKIFEKCLLNNQGFLIVVELRKENL